MIDFSDFIVKESKRLTSRFNNETNKTKYYRCCCDNCEKDRGYISKSRFNKKPYCVKCATNTSQHKNKLKQSHWKNRNISPKQWMKLDPTSPLRIRLGTNLRSRLYQALKNNYKTGSAVQDLGCSIDKLKIHLQLQFHRNPRGKHEYMTWDNYGRFGWHIDHIKPLSSFDLNDPKQFKEACHWKNLQPLWAKDNLSKGDRVS